MSEMARAGMSDAARAARAWNVANGDRERTHTCGVYLQKARRPGMAPRLVVYVDTSAWVTEMSVNKDLYLARLANVGFAVSAVDFRLSRMPKRDTRPRNRESAARRADRELTADERAQVEELLSRAPAELRERIRPSIEASITRGEG